jgi:integrase
MTRRFSMRRLQQSDRRGLRHRLLANVREDVRHQPPDDLLGVHGRPAALLDVEPLPGHGLEGIERRQALGPALFHDLGLGPGGLLGLAQVARVLAFGQEGPRLVGLAPRQAAKARANREKALLSHMFNKAREWGYTDAPNPCQGVKGFTEVGRDRYVSDAEFAAVRAAAHPTVQDAMDVALLTGQRPADVLKILRCDIRDGALFVTQNKTGAKRAIDLVGELAAVIERITSRPRERQSLHLIQDDNGRQLTALALRSRFDKARRAAGVRFQFRDIRAKTASDTGDLGHSQRLLGHKNRDMTEHYVRERIGQRVKPLR